VKIGSEFICNVRKIAGGWGSAPYPMVTAVCLYIKTSLAYDRVLEKCFWGSGKFLEMFVTNSGNPVSTIAGLFCNASSSYADRK